MNSKDNLIILRRVKREENNSIGGRNNIWNGKGSNFHIGIKGRPLVVKVIRMGWIWLTFWRGIWPFVSRGIDKLDPFLMLKAYVVGWNLFPSIINFILNKYFMNFGVWLQWGLRWDMRDRSLSRHNWGGKVKMTNGG